MYKTAFSSDNFFSLWGSVGLMIGKDCLGGRLANPFDSLSSHLCSGRRGSRLGSVTGSLNTCFRSLSPSGLRASGWAVACSLQSSCHLLKNKCLFFVNLSANLKDSPILLIIVSLLGCEPNFLWNSSLWAPKKARVTSYVFT